ncbi:hypothetical protein FEF22_000925 [Texas Phoenix palm phytoplasma]|uniref:Uncharacterized protein n=1 Tax=Texas Phoenix palm phytoplasma TaxID=176709 RepID=A0ABS5BJ18_9MOLU|nr:hypothetical protein [Texas Phoenix palm phytoplasma]MBP3059351.1 hypothetical protein [Texas Phoenix palm phytoplasma]
MYFVREKLILVLVAFIFAILGALLFEVGAEKAKIYEDNSEIISLVNSFILSAEQKESKISIGFQDKILHKWYQLIMSIVHGDRSYFSK